jgi:cell wall-associated NlpC family hydrolase
MPFCGRGCTYRHKVPINSAEMRLILLLGLTLAVGACASTGAVPRPFPTPGGRPPAATTGDPAAPDRPAAPVAPASLPAGAADGYSISSTALSLRGAPYRNGGTDPAGFDCSGFVKYVFEQYGIAMPRDVRRQFDVGSNVDTSALEPGDLVFFSTVAPGASHVGIAVGGDQFVHAPSSSGVVRVERLSAQYWSTRFVGAKRVN